MEEKTVAELFDMVNNSYRVMEMVAKEVLRRAPEQLKPNAGVALTNAQTFLMTGTYWIGNAAQLISGDAE